MKIVVLFGGTSTERAVSLVSGKRVAATLARIGDKVHLFDYRFEGFSPEMVKTLRQADAVFPVLHGTGGEDGRLQQELETLGVPHYVGSAPASSALAMDKRAAKRIVSAKGIPTATDTIWLPHHPRPDFPFPMAIKPLSGGSSVGLILAQNATRLATYAPTEPMLCEALLTGREFTVGILEGEALPVVEIIPRSGVYDYDAKYRPGATEELCPAPLSAQKTAVLQKSAQIAFRALGLRDFARIDFKCDSAGHPFFLEANTLPGLTGTSLFPLAAQTAGISFPLLLRRLCSLAAARHPPLT